MKHHHWSCTFQTLQGGIVSTGQVGGSQRGQAEPFNKIPRWVRSSRVPSRCSAGKKAHEERMDNPPSSHNKCGTYFSSCFLKWHFQAACWVVFLSPKSSAALPDVENLNKTASTVSTVSMTTLMTWVGGVMVVAGYMYEFMLREGLGSLDVLWSKFVDHWWWAIHSKEMVCEPPLNLLQQASSRRVFAKILPKSKGVTPVINLDSQALGAYLRSKWKLCGQLKLKKH